MVTRGTFLGGKKWLQGVIGGQIIFHENIGPCTWFLPRMRKTVAKPILSLASSFTRPGSSIKVDCRRQIPNR